MGTPAPVASRLRKRLLWQRGRRLQDWPGHAPPDGVVSCRRLHWPREPREASHARVQEQGNVQA